VYTINGNRHLLSKVGRDRYFWLEQVKGKIINRFASGSVLLTQLVRHE
jgi:hypothetical protein